MLTRIKAVNIVGKTIKSVKHDLDLVIIFTDSSFCHLEVDEYSLTDGEYLSGEQMVMYGILTAEELPAWRKIEAIRERADEERRMRALHAQFLISAPEAAEQFIQRHLDNQRPLT